MYLPYMGEVKIIKYRIKTMSYSKLSKICCRASP